MEERKEGWGLNLFPPPSLPGPRSPLGFCPTQTCLEAFKGRGAPVEVGSLFCSHGVGVLPPAEASEQRPEVLCLT